jgi:poly(3-hydroxybutyrate) depolymerase
MDPKIRNMKDVSNLEKWGFMYVPSGCKADPAACRLHVNYHGCMYERWDSRKEWANLLDLNEYGETNNVIIYYPQVAGSDNAGTGCWNWSEYEEDPNFDTRQGYQLATVNNVV